MVVESVINLSGIKELLFSFAEVYYSKRLPISDKRDVIIETYLENKKYCFIINDNGIGFDVEKKLKGNGIKNIRTRLKAINAKYEFISNPNSGTKLKFCIS